MALARKILSRRGGGIGKNHDIIIAAKKCDLPGLKAAVASDTHAVNFQDEDTGLTALHIVAGHGHRGCVEYLLSVDGIDATIRDNEYRAPWDLADAIGRSDLVSLIFGTTFRDVLDAIDDDASWEPEPDPNDTVVRFPGHRGPSGMS